MINITILKTDTTQVNITVSKQGLLQTLQGIVGGYIQVLGLDRKTIMIVNEEGLLKNYL